MPFTDKDEADLRAIVRQKKNSPITAFLKDSPEYERQFGKNSQRAAAPAKPIKGDTPFHTGDEGKNPEAYKRGGSIKKFAKGGSIDGIAQKGKTRGKYI